MTVFFSFSRLLLALRRLAFLYLGLARELPIVPMPMHGPTFFAPA